MEVLKFILIVVFCTVSIFKVVTVGDKDDIDILKIVFFIITTILCLVSIIAIIDETCKLGEKDVLTGKAEYVETIHISKGDTIKTYHIQPKK